MGLRLKFNVVMFIAFAIGLGISYKLSQAILIENAKQEVELNASLLMEAAKSIRAYTTEEIRPLLNQLDSENFLPQTVPAFAATDNLERIKKAFPDYSYKEAAINPTNPSHRASSWEREVIQHFKDNKNINEYTDIRNTPTGKLLFLSRPLRVSSTKCLACHSTPQVAPSSMIRAYGTNNGFGWKHKEIIGAQIINVPMSVPLSRANQALQTFILALTIVFIIIWLVLNVLLHFVVINPVKKMAENANKISLGDLETPEFETAGKDEIASLGNSFNRMYRSLTSAVKLLDET